jgi:hypothetical protein
LLPGALEVSPQYQSLRLALAQHVLELAHNLASILHVEESIHYFQVILSILSSSTSPEGSGDRSHLQEDLGEIVPTETWHRETLLIKIKTFLGLGFLRKELNQCDKAIRLIDQAQDLNREMTLLTANTSSPVKLSNETFTFAKFSIFCRDNDIKAAETSL